MLMLTMVPSSSAFVQSFILLPPPSTTTTTSDIMSRAARQHNVSLLAASSRTSDSQQNSSKKQKQKQNDSSINTGKLNPNGTKQKQKQTQKKRRASQQDIHNLVHKIGLQPVVTNSANTNSANTNINTNTNSANKRTPLSKPIPIKTQLQYARKGHTVLRNILDKPTLTNIHNDLVQYASQRQLEAWQQKVEVKLSLPSSKVKKLYTTPKACQDILNGNGNSNGHETTTTIPFLQHFNTWRHLPSVHTLVHSPILTQAAKELMDVKTVKLYQDSLFHKRPGDGPTPWHSDARMAPFDTSNMITFWIPLMYIPNGGTGLMFVNGSHNDFALPFWNSRDGNVSGSGSGSDGTTGTGTGGEYDRLDERYGGEEGITDYMPMDMGDMTAHSGWTLHCAAAGMGRTDMTMGQQQERYALAVTYVDDMAEIREDAIAAFGDSAAVGVGPGPGHDEDRRSYEGWVKDVEPRCYFEHPLVPTL